MNRFSFLISSIVVAAVIAFAVSPVSAAIVEYTDEVTFEAALSSYYQEWFNDYDGWGEYQSIDFSSGSYSYTITAAPYPYLLAIPWPTEFGAIQAYDEGSTLLFTMTGSSVTAAGGYFFAANYDGEFVAETITVTVELADSSTESYTTGASSDDFRGYISDSSPITSLSVSSTGASEMCPTVDGFIIEVPEPGTLALLAAGLAGLLCYAWRKRK